MFNGSEVQLLEVEKNLWNLYRSILANRRLREMMTGFGDAECRMTYQRQAYRPILSIFDLLDRVLDKGMVIDANISIALVGIEIVVYQGENSSSGH